MMIRLYSMPILRTLSLQQRCLHVHPVLSCSGRLPATHEALLKELNVQAPEDDGPQIEPQDQYDVERVALADQIHIMIICQVRLGSIFLPCSSCATDI